MNALVMAGARALEVLRAARIDACVIGGLAVARWGEPRLTADVDVVAVSMVEHDVDAVDALLAAFAPRRAGARQFALEHRVLLIQDAGGVPLDVSLGALEFEQDMVARASAWTVEGCPPIRTCSAEDLVVMKAFASRDRDWSDIAGIIARQGARLDRAAIRERFAPLAEFARDPAAAARLFVALER